MKHMAKLFGIMIVTLATGMVRTNAQTLTTLYDFCSVTDSFFCADGSFPDHLIQGTDGKFYGTTSSGGTNDHGTAFQITPQGTLTTLVQFSSTDGIGADLSLELGGLLYGTMLTGGTNHQGAIFTLTTSGTLTTLYQFSGTNGIADGAGPVRLMQVNGSTLIGTTIIGGTNNDGTVFKITTAGTLTTLHEFSGTNGVADGAEPELTVANGSEFIGSTFVGGTGNTGTVFEITAAGSFNTIHTFTPAEGGIPIVTIVNGNNFIGTTTSGGSNGFGTAFQMTSQGTVTTFYTFSGSNGVMDGSSPGLSSVQNHSGAYYGITQDGGTNASGLIFTLSTSGTLTPVYEFCSAANCADGNSPSALATLVGSDFYGTTDGGGANNDGTVFKLAVSGGSSGGGCTYELGSTNQNFAAAGGSSTVGVIASNGCAWSAMSNDGFITITGSTNGTGNGTVHYSVAANTSTNPLSGSMTIAGLTFTVTQDGAGVSTGSCTFTVSPTTITLTSKGGKKSVSVKIKSTTCDWTAVSNDSFISITSGASGTGSGKVSITVPGNTNTTALSGTITVAGQTVTVNQAAGGCTFKLSPKAGKIKSTGGTATIKVSPNFSDCDWTAVSNDGFITITGGTNGVGKGAVTYSVPANATTNVLTGTITVAGQTFTVTQAGTKP
ncbi:MAG TPA: choice-of-anchor tandem repeat GloVer-containing protein [Verrucomicrobiae bacterium]|nr:choice-of-anchor tandem repeat GloVer-containing protein [Verrucomicrobiae bacterium]